MRQKNNIVIAAMTLLMAFAATGAEAQPRLFVGPNEPLGRGVGIHPGRVAWIHSPGVAAWDGQTGLWVENRWNDQRKADAMVREAVTQLTGEKTARKAWAALFRNFNKTHGRGSRGYREGEKIAIKLNMNNALTHRDTIELNSSPFVTLALVRSLINDGGVRQADITVCEPSRAITDSIYDKCHREFPGVVFVDNIGGDGRQKCDYYEEQIKYSADNGRLVRGLAKCIVDADYLINSALLKTHKGPGVTLTAKNWYGATDINLQWRKNAHNNFDQNRDGTPKYMTFVDFMGHKDLGGKTLLWLIDGLYGCKNVGGEPGPLWTMEPFNGQWPCSLIGSLDPVAIDMVGIDLLTSQFPDMPDADYSDMYLIEAAQAGNAPSGTAYDPEGDGTTLKSLGVAEHWNNATDRQYSRNLGKEEGIELVYERKK